MEVYVRFYEELNDFLAPERRKRLFSYPLRRELTVGQLLQEIGAPLSQIDLVLLNGMAVDFSHPLRAGDRVSVYPVFERFDVTAVQRLRKAPLRRTRFQAGAELAPLARYLRLLGFDTVMGRMDWEPGRVLLVRERDRTMRQDISHRYVVPDRTPREQVRALLRDLDLHRSVQPLSRCLCCNALVRDSRCAPCGTTFSALRLRRMRALAAFLCL